MNHLFRVLLVILLVQISKAQTLQWGKSIGSLNDDVAGCLGIDVGNNIITAGTFRAQIDLDPGPNTVNFNCSGNQDIFITKSDSSGNYQWGRKIGGPGIDSITAIYCDNNAIYLTGFFQGTTDFDPGSNIFFLTSTGNPSTSDAFLVKLNAFGAFQWAINLGGSDNDQSMDIAVRNGEVVITGSFTSTADFDPATSSSFTLSSDGAEDIFIAKYSTTNGALIFAEKVGGLSNDIGTSIDYDINNNIVVTGTFSQLVDFNPDTNLVFSLNSELGSADCFVLKLDNSGTFQWAQYIAGPEADFASEITSDASGAIYITGGFRNITNFDPGQSNLLLSSLGLSDGFITKYSTAGQFEWARPIGGAGDDIGNFVFCDVSNNLYATGHFSGNLTLNTTLNSNGGTDAFLVKYDINGTCSWSGNLGGSNDDAGFVVVTDASNKLYAAGTVFAPNADLDPTSGTFITPGNNLFDAFYIKINQNTLCPPAVSIAASPAGSVCQGTNIEFTATATNGGNNPQYNWFVNGLPTGDTSVTFITSSLNDGDAISCQVTSSAVCAIPSSASSNTINATIVASIAASLSISASPSTICQGTTVTFTSNVLGTGSNPSYQWLVNGIPTGVTSPDFASNSLSSGDVITCQLFNSDPCVSPSVAISNPIVVFVNPPVIQSITISANTTTICNGGAVTFTANYSPSNLVAPTFQWIVNGNRINGATSSTFTSTSIPNGAIVVCEFSSQTACLSNPTVTSNQVVISVSQNITPAVSITASATTICPGTAVTFTATVVNGGNNPTYQWFVNNVPQPGQTGSTFTISTLTNNNSVRCVITSSLTCVSTPTVNSNSIVITTSTSLSPTISIQNLSGTTCLGSPALLEATYQFGGTNPTFSWLINNQPTGTNSPQLTINNPVDNAFVRCVMVSNDACASSAPVNSNTVILDVTSAQPPVITDVAGTLFSTTATTYQWLLNGDTIPGADSIRHVPLRAGFYQVFITDSNGCVASSNLVLITAPGIDELDPVLENAFIYPNPASENFFIRFGQLTSASLIVSSLDGRVIQEISSLNTDLFSIDSSGWPNGIYLVKMSTEKGVRFVRIAVLH